MGAGNPLLKSFSDDKFNPTTYFLDLSTPDEAAKQSLIDNGNPEPDDVEIEREIDELNRMNFEDLIESICSELNHSAWDLNSRANYYPELAAAFREEGIILTEGKLCYVITQTGADYYHLPIAVIPTFKFESFLEDAQWEMEDKRNWYDARRKDFDAAVEKLADKRWDKEMKDFHLEAEKILKTLHGWFGENMSMRGGAWTSGPVDGSSLAA